MMVEIFRRCSLQSCVALLGLGLAVSGCSDDPSMATGPNTPGPDFGPMMPGNTPPAASMDSMVQPPTDTGMGMVMQPPADTGMGMDTDTMLPDDDGGEVTPDDGADTGGAGEGGTEVPPETGGGLTIPPDHCLADITNYDSDGPFSYDSGRSGAINFWVPQVPAGCKVPVVHVANGTGATCSFYNSAIRRMASHGFLTACYENTNTGAGTQGLEALMTAVSEYPEVADLRFGSTGHSQGGQASFVVLQLAEAQWGDEGVYAGLAMQPASGFGSQPSGGWRTVYGNIKSPMFMFSGAGTDGLVSQRWVQDGFDALDASVEAYHWAKSGSSHFSPNGPQMEVSIAWFRWKLLGDQMACQHFKTVREDSSWEEAAVQNEAPCM